MACMWQKNVCNFKKLAVAVAVATKQNKSNKSTASKLKQENETITANAHKIICKCANIKKQIEM